MSKTWTDPLDVRVEHRRLRVARTCECKIVDPETGEELPDGADRRVLLARGYNIMKGYYKMPDATAAADRRERLAALRRPRSCRDAATATS